MKLSRSGVHGVVWMEKPTCGARLLNESCVCVCRSLSNVARSVLLTSGTLSPLDSFSGELGLDFHVRLEAPHVVDVHRQVGGCVVGV
jgi:Rad3-related DNA helicase